MLLGSTAFGEVTECSLKETEEHQTPRFSVYEYDGVIHSVFLEFTTDYGDTLPYLFVCGVNCMMDFVGDDFLYSVSILPNLSTPERIVLLTESRNDDYRNREEFEVLGCNAR